LRNRIYDFIQVDLQYDFENHFANPCLELVHESDTTYRESKYPLYEDRTPTLNPFHRPYLALAQVCSQLRGEFLPILKASTLYIHYVKLNVAHEYIETLIFGHKSQSIAEVEAKIYITFEHVHYMVELDDFVALLRRAPGLRLSIIGGWRWIYDLEAVRFIEWRLE
jgi:hypothetical protein